MGFDTYLLVGDEVALDWRKYASPMPRMLFTFEDLVIDVDMDDPDDPRPRVEFRTTAGRALSSLEKGGFGWEACVAVFSEMRGVNPYLEGMIIAKSMHGVGHFNDDRQADPELIAFNAISPADDLANLGKEMVSQWQDESIEPWEVLFLSHLSFDGDLPRDMEAAGLILKRYGAEALSLSTFSAMRAAMVLSQLDRSASLIAWPVVLAVFLQHLEAETPVVLDLSEDAVQNLQYGVAVTPEQYAVNYWESATRFLVDESRSMLRLWGVLAAFDSQLGSEYWYARSAGYLRRIKDKDHQTPKERGDLLESLMDALVRAQSPELSVVEKNLKTPTSEIDLVLANSLTDPFWLAMRSPLIFVECKNWTKTVGVPELRVFETKIADKGALCRIGVFVSLSGFTKPFIDRLATYQREDGIIFVINGAEITEIVEGKVSIFTWLKTHGIRRPLARA